MKVLFHINSLGHGGAERVVSVLSHEFTLVGHEVVIATEWEAQSEYNLDKEVKRLNAGLDATEENKGRITKIILRHTKLRKCIKEQKPDVVISFCNKANFRCSVAMLGMKIPLIVSVRNDPVKDYLPYKFSTILMEKKASGCVFQTPDAQNFFSEELKNKSQIIVNPLDEKYINSDYEYNANIWSSEDEKIIMAVGRICEQKNQLLLIKAFSKIAAKVPESKVMIFGDVQEGEYLDRVNKLIDDNGLNERITLCGLSDNIPEEIKKAYMFVLSSDYEGMPNALLEAMAIGIPCISTDCPCGGSKMMIVADDTDARNGILVPVGDEEALALKMYELLTNKDEANMLAKNAKGIRKRVLSQSVAKEWLNMIEKIVAKK